MPKPHIAVYSRNKDEWEPKIENCIHFEGMQPEE
jgi:hypothetical protein